MASLKRDFTQGNILGHLIRFGAPFLLSSFLQALYNVTDMWAVGNFSTVQAQAGVTNGGQITNVVVMIVAGLTVGGTILVGQYYGAKREKDVSETIGTLFSVLLLGDALTWRHMVGGALVILGVVASIRVPGARAAG